jgi:putative peptide zinc metalloprotease protein
MAEMLLSSHWHRVAELRPRLRGHVRVHRHRYRGKLWFVVQDLAGGRLHRFTPRAHQIIGLLDGTRSVEEIWRLCGERMGDQAPSQDALIRLLVQLHAGDLLESDAVPDVSALLERQRVQERMRLWARLLSPFSIQLRLYDPTPLLNRTVHWVRPLLGRRGLALWLAVVAPALVLAVLHFEQLSESVWKHVPTPQGVLLLWLLFPVLKTLHELGHAYATRAYGGEVHDLGLLFMLLTPVPYVDASSASAFPERGPRVVVGAAGMIVETFLAALALYLWLATEDGVVRTLAFHTLLIGGVSTVAFNANPLLRFDGYYILSDLLEIPNLRQRASAYLSYLVRRHALRAGSAEPPEGVHGERGWLAGYALGSFVYRTLVLFWIAFFVLEWSLLLGTVLLGVSAIGWLGVPLARGLRALATSPALEGRRVHAVGLAAGAAALLAGLVFGLPVPLRAHAQGVVWLPEESLVRAREAGFVVRVVAVPGSPVAAGDVLIECEDPERTAEVVALQARVDALDAERRARSAQDRVAARLADEQLRFAREELARGQQRAADLRIRAARAGLFVLRRPDDLPGRFVRKGEVLGHLVDFGRIAVRTVIAQEDVRLVQERSGRVAVRLAEQLDQEHEARVARLLPGASRELPSRALGASAGGAIAEDPRSLAAPLALEASYQLELELLAPLSLVNAGGRAYLRFELGSEPLAQQWLRRLRQLFLARLHV